MEPTTKVGAQTRAVDTTAPALRPLEAAWAALTPHEQFVVNRMYACFPPNRVGNCKTSDAYADVIKNRGGTLPANPDANFSFLTYQEQKIVEWSAWRQHTRRIVGEGDYVKLYRDIVAWRNP